MPSAPNGGLNYVSTTDKPIRGVTIELLDATGNTLATTQSDTLGDYSFTATSPQTMRVRVRAEMVAANHDFRVRDNTNAYALYVVDSALFTPTASSTTMNMRAASGWGINSYTGTRAAAPFALLDVAYAAQLKVATVAPTTVLPPLSIFWSPNNRPALGQLSEGNIGASFFTSNGFSRSMYILGAENTDTDEYDQPVVAHELGHFIQDALSRDDSVGGSHSAVDKLEMRLAFSEGWATAWAAMVLNNPVYHDSSDARQANGFAYSAASAPGASYRGWFNEQTVTYLLWQNHQDGDIGFAGIYQGLTALRTSPAFSTLHNFNHQLRAAAPMSASIATSRATAMGVAGSDLHGAGETNNGGLVPSLPVYATHNVALGESQLYCVHSPQNGGNKLGDYAYIKFNATGPRKITVTRDASTVEQTDPDLMLLRSDGLKETAYSGVANTEVLTVRTALPSGTHVLALNDDAAPQQSTTPGEVATQCFALRID